MELQTIFLVFLFILDIFK